MSDIKAARAESTQEENGKDSMDQVSIGTNSSTDSVPNDLEKGRGAGPDAEAKTEVRPEDHPDMEGVLQGSKMYACIFSCITTLFLLALDQTITMAAITPIADHFQAFDKMTWITAGFSMPLGACAQMWGRLSISFGRKWVTVTGICIFEVGSLIAALANSMDMLIAGRSIQGLGGACIQTCTMMIMTEVTPVRKRPAVFALVTLTFITASVIGPLVGGAFTTYVSWRWCFYINLCCAAVILPLFVLSYYPKPVTGTIWEKLKTVDVIDNFLLVASCILILLAISFGVSGTTYKTGSVISCFVLSGVFFIGFIFWNARSKYPTLPLDIILNIRILADFISFGFGYSVMLVMFQFLSVYFQNIEGHNAMHTGIALIPVAVCGSLGALIGALTTRLTGYLKPLSLVSTIIQPIGVGLMTLLTVKEQLGKDIGFQILLGLACGLNFQPTIINAQFEAPSTPNSLLLVTAYMNFGRSMGTALFSEIGSAIYMSRLKSQLPTAAAKLQETEYPISSIINEISLLFKLSTSDQLVVKEVILNSIKDVFWFALGVSIVAFIASLFISNKKMPRGLE